MSSHPLNPRFHWQGSSIWTLNATKGKTVYGERLRKIKGHEYRKWDPTRSKIGAALTRSKSLEEYLIPQPGEEILYLGAGHGTTISHLHDVVCGYEKSQGRIFLINLDVFDLHHFGIVPVMADVKHKLMEHDDSQWCSVDVSRCQSSRTSRIIRKPHQSLVFYLSNQQVNIRQRSRPS